MWLRWVETEKIVPAGLVFNIQSLLPHLFIYACCNISVAKRRYATGVSSQHLKCSY